MSEFKAMTLGDATAAAAALPGTLPVVTDDGREVVGLGSYRGYYDHLAIEPRGFERGPHWTVADLVSALRAADGKTFQGYKGGDYLMANHTAMWVAESGEASDARLVAIEERDGKAVLVTVDLGW